MKYFIDFEATQFAGEIISIGCIREDGETFYSLIKPSKSKVTSLITDLTGITSESLETAPTADSIFEEFYDWLLTDKNGIPDFFAWGHEDVDFLRHTFNKTTSLKARIAMGYITGSICDYSKKFCKKLKIKSCSLIEAYRALIKSNAKQNHNSLEDAKMLAKVYQYAETTRITKLRENCADLIKKKENKK